MANITNNAVANMVNLGQYGSKLISGASAILPPDGYVFVALQAVDADFVCSAAVRQSTDFADIAGRTIAKGQTVYGRWTSVTGTASDFAIAYVAPKD